MTNEEQVARIQGGETGLLYALWERNSGLVYDIVRKHWHSKEDIEDGTQEAYIHFHAAVYAYKESGGASFATFARRAIEWGIIKQRRARSFAKVDEPTRKRFEAIREKYKPQYGESIPPHVIVSLLGVTFETALALIRPPEVASLDEELRGLDSVPLSEAVESPETPIDDLIEEMARQQDAAAIWGIVDALPAAQADVIRQEYRDGRTRGEIAARTGRSVWQVAEQHHRALLSLKRNRRLNEIYRGSSLYRGTAAAFRRTWTSTTEAAAIRAYYERLATG